MVNPMMFGVSPQQAQAAKEIGNQVTAKLNKHRSQASFTVTFVPKNSPAVLNQMGIDLGKMVDGMVENMGTQLYSFFGIGGEIVDAD